MNLYLLLNCLHATVQINLYYELYRLMEISSCCDFALLFLY